MTHFRSSGMRVVGTTRRPGNVSESTLFLDLSDSVEEWSCPWPVTVAVVCASVTKLDECRRDPERSALVNVCNTSVLIRELVAKNAFVVFLSSSNVFDGSVPYRSPDDPLSPITEYGRQKAEVEQQIRSFGDSVSIVRMSKVLGPEFPLFAVWKQALRKGEAIPPFEDMTLAPIPLRCVISVLSLVCDLRLTGVLQVAGSRDVSYAEAALVGAKALGADPGLVQPVKASESNRFKEPWQKHTTLNVDRLRAKLGIEVPDVEWTIETAFTDPQIRVGLHSKSQVQT